MTVLLVCDHQKECPSRWPSSSPLSQRKWRSRDPQAAFAGKKTLAEVCALLQDHASCSVSFLGIVYFGSAAQDRQSFVKKHSPPCEQPSTSPEVHLMLLFSRDRFPVFSQNFPWPPHEPDGSRNPGGAFTIFLKVWGLELGFPDFWGCGPSPLIPAASRREILLNSANNTYIHEKYHGDPEKASPAPYRSGFIAKCKPHVSWVTA